MGNMLGSGTKSEGGCGESSQELTKVRRVSEQAQSGSSREGSVKGNKDAKEEDGALASESSDSEDEGKLNGKEAKETSCQEPKSLNKESQGSFPALPRELCSAQPGLRRSRELLSAPRREREAKPSAPPWGPFPEAIPRRGAAARELPSSSPEQEVMHGPPFSAQSRPLSYAPPPAGRYFYRRLWQGGRLSHEVHPPGIDSGPYEIFPVQVAMGQGRNVWEPFEIKQIRELKNAVTTFGPTAPYTIAMLENLSSGPLTPADWIQLAKACLPSGSYLDWRAWYAEFSAEQAEKNANRGNRGWNKKMLMGEGRHADDQTQFPGAVYEQINAIGLRAWKQVSGAGTASLCLSKIIQGTTEPFVDFVARMQDAADKIFSDPGVAQPLVRQLIFEQCTKECKAAIAPHKNKDLNAWIRICREIGGPLSNSGVAALLAAAVQQRGPRGLEGECKAKGCFACGEPGHIKRHCPNNADARPRPRNEEPYVCGRCKKGSHKAEECRSVFDAQGNRICGQDAREPKNGQRGPPSQTGPRPRDRTAQGGSLQQGPPLGQQVWTSVSPPDLYGCSSCHLSLSTL
ncbi:endogenous retrovirus group K member 113 Gag polyprotein-like [Cavia porcellus]|uniref:endogenous retrovirus group K member 113 Gag polyprotein-like n=1 Tax=Cavia porcellus TaxID=10141 RepID=UPI002FDF2B45